MSQISDAIERFIMEMMADGGEAELQRNKLAVQFRCAPSQINYVLATRFTSQQGYVIESRRGGGGYIRIIRISDDGRGLFSRLKNQIGESLTRRDGRLIIQRMMEGGTLSPQTAISMDAALADENFEGIPPEERDRIRARIFLNMMLAVISNRR